jgi:hypothetical protein
VVESRAGTTTTREALGVVAIATGAEAEVRTKERSLAEVRGTAGAGATMTEVLPGGP